MADYQRYFLQIAYNGKPYHGWQIQPNAVTVQERINLALSHLTGQKVYTLGCGRTDTGVHAREFYLHFDLEQPPHPDLVFRLNRYLERDIAVQRMIPVAHNAHARYDATQRTYHYHLHQTEDPFLQGLSYFHFQPLDFELMNRAAGLLLKYTDYSPLSKFNPDNKTTLCTITEAHWQQDDRQPHRWVFSITANRFLWNQVRLTVGILLQIGQKKLSLEAFEETLRSVGQFKILLPVPAEGLYLVKVKYPYL